MWLVHSNEIYITGAFLFEEMLTNLGICKWILAVIL